MIRKYFAQKDNFSKLIILLVFTFSILIFIRIFFGNHINSDLKVHIDGLIYLLKKNSFPIPPLYFFSIYLFGIIIHDSTFVLPAIVVLSFSATYKFIITEQYLRAEIKENVQLPYLKKIKDIFPLMLAVCCILAVPLTYSLKFYIGKIGINIWHNSTTIFLMPFALLLFFKSYEYINSLERKTTFPWQIFLLAIINILIKPSYFFVFVCCFPFFVFIKHRFSKKTLYAMTICIFCLAILLIEFHLLYQVNQFSYGTKQDKSTVIIAPFLVWRNFSNTIFIDLILSIAFPLSVIIFYFKEIKSNIFMQYAIANFIVSVIIFILLAETGRKAFDGNFEWQAIVCNYILFFCCTVFFFQKISRLSKWNIKAAIPAVCFSLHIFTGFLYLIKYFVFGKYG